MKAQDQTSGGAPARKSAFDEAERERIRAALFRYMEEHRIGVPTLIAHMAKAVKREAQYIPQKTVQRFLANDMRTNDASVRVFYEFALGLPPGKDELAELAAGLSKFFNEVSAAVAPRQRAAMSDGAYQAYAGSPAAHEKDLFSRIAAGFLTVTTKAARTHVAERRLAPPLPPSARPGLPYDHKERGEAFEGVLVRFDSFEVGVMRSTATRKPRVHFFARHESVLWSECQSAPVTGAEGELLLSERLHFEYSGAGVP